MDFEKIEVEEESAEEASLLRDVSIGYAVDHYRNLVMSRYPSELDELMQIVMPESKRYASKERQQDGSGILLLYHYLLHGFRSNGLKIANVIESEDERVHTHRVWMTYLQMPPEEIDICTYSDFPERACQKRYDAIFLNHYDHERSTSGNVENIYDYILFALQTLKPYGFVSIEGIPYVHIHMVQSVIAVLYLYPELCQIHVLSPLVTLDTSTFTVIVRRTFDERRIPESCMPLYFPVPRLMIPDHPQTFVLVTSAFKSMNNSNIIPARTRWRQLLHTIRTVRRKIPNAFVTVTDVSELSEQQVDDLRNNGVDEIRVFAQLEGVAKSFSESVVMHRVFSDVLLRSDCPFSHAIKLSGRYFFTQRFSFKNTDEIVCKRMRPREVMTRYIQVPRRLFERYVSVLKQVSEMPSVVRAECDIEHALGMTFPEMDEAGAQTCRIDVAGFYATVGQMLVE